MIPEELKTQIGADLIHHLQSADITDHTYFDIYKYSTLPPGKLFRSSLVWTLLADLKKIKLEQLNTADYPNHQLISSSIELHHAYTLAHDDLPCMDNDEIRRGKKSLHVKYNEWKALLIGDGLLNLSYELLTRLNNPNTLEIIQIFSKKLGPNGLIYGQYLDLNYENTNDFNDVIKIHKLKTANLFEVALITSYLAYLKAPPKEAGRVKKLSKIAQDIGICFQLIDDLTELACPTIGAHEISINPWPKSFQACISEMKPRINNITKYSQEFPQVYALVEAYLQKITNFLEVNKKNIEQKLNSQEKLDPIILLLNQLHL